MSISASPSRGAASPLEQFVLDYVEASGGAWDLVEPQVYDILLPPAGTGSDGWDAGNRGVLRVAFDPEALPDHPDARLASFGAPMIDRWLDEAMVRGRLAELHVTGLNLAPYDLATRVRRTITLAPDLELNVERCRPLDFLQAVFWFQATFASDQKEQEIVPVAIDLHFLRQVRHLEQLLEASRLTERPAVAMAEARRASVAAAYPIAQEQVLRTVAAMANVRSRELTERTELQAARMTQYYSDLRSELADQQTRSLRRREDSGDSRETAEGSVHKSAKFEDRLQALHREQQLRISELRQKSALRVHLRVLNLLILHQPKVLVRAALGARCAATGGTPARRGHGLSTVAPTRQTASLDLVWDPLMESLEACTCTVCGHPTFSVSLTRTNAVACMDCASGVSAVSNKARR